MSINKQELNIEKLIDVADWEIEKPQFAQLYNFVLQNLIDPVALTIWCYLQSKPSNWRPRKKEIESHFPTIGRDKAHKAFMTLKECGLYEANSVKNKETGLVDGWKIKIKCGIGCEQLILSWKAKFIETNANKKKRKTKIHTTENQECGKNHTTENQNSGFEAAIETGSGLIQNTDFPESGESVVIQKKENSLEKKEKEKINNKPDLLLTNSLTKELSPLELIEIFKTQFPNNPLPERRASTGELPKKIKNSIKEFKKDWPTYSNGKPLTKQSFMVLLNAYKQKMPGFCNNAYNKGGNPNKERNGIESFLKWENVQDLLKEKGKLF